MDRKRTRSRSGWRALRASSSTRVLKASHDSSRLMKRSRGGTASTSTEVLATDCAADGGTEGVEAETRVMSQFQALGRNLKGLFKFPYEAETNKANTAKIH